MRSPGAVARDGAMDAAPLDPLAASFADRHPDGSHDKSGKRYHRYEDARGNHRRDLLKLNGVTEKLAVIERMRRPERGELHRNDKALDVVLAGHTPGEVVRLMTALHASPSRTIERWARTPGAKLVGHVRPVVARASHAEIDEVLAVTPWQTIYNLLSWDYECHQVFGADYVDARQDLDPEKDERGRRKWTAFVERYKQGPWPEEAFDELQQKTPSGRALPAADRAAIDTLAFDDRISSDAFEHLFRLRWGAPLAIRKDARACGSNPAYRQHLWATLAQLPFAHITTQTLQRVSLKGECEDAPGALGMTTPDITKEVAPGIDIYESATSYRLTNPALYWGQFEKAVRHELGHTMDFKVGGYESFAARTPAKWRRFSTPEGFAHHLAVELGAASSEEAIKAAVAASDGGGDVDAIKDALGDVQTKDGTKPEDFARALQQMREHRRGSKKGPAVGKLRLNHVSAGAYESHLAEQEDIPAISSYGYSSSGEFFAECYAFWFQPVDRTDASKGYCEDKHPHAEGGKLPSFVRAAGFDQLVETPEHVKWNIPDIRDHELGAEKPEGAKDASTSTKAMKGKAKDKGKGRDTSVSSEGL